ncbi:hypothetical protein B0H17DRAFT_1334865 [Mycena rosella]|uniref:Uncharacterized protein n=1 Tax=Mycena rosella TaxID=1033263 RepID=A0AAD7D1T6_MYCRO|nr:hypothetical protein B0H17DRAFT_1334865 [Mycena rosella]
MARQSAPDFHSTECRGPAEKSLEIRTLPTGGNPLDLDPLSTSALFGRIPRVIWLAVYNSWSTLPASSLYHFEMGRYSSQVLSYARPATLAGATPPHSRHAICLPHLPSTSIGLSDSLNILETYLSPYYAPYVTEDRGETSIIALSRISASRDDRTYFMAWSPSRNIFRRAKPVKREDPEQEVDLRSMGALVEGGVMATGQGMKEEEAPGNRFLITDVFIPPRTTPQNPVPPAGTALTERRSICHCQALRLARAVDVALPDLPHFTYLPLTDGARGGIPYHATRHSTLINFQEAGVNPVLYAHSNFFSPAPSFNLADTVEAALSHVLHGMPTFCDPHTGLPTDPIMLLAFDIDLAGGMPSSRTKNSLEQRVGGNRLRNGKGALPQDHDFVFGPFLVPLQNNQHRVADGWTGTQPIHVAAVSRAAFNALSDTLVAICVEREDPSTILP